jgi:hypothetical protein
MYICVKAIPEVTLNFKKTQINLAVKMLSQYVAYVNSRPDICSGCNQIITTALKPSIISQWFNIAGNVAARFSMLACCRKREIIH